MRILVSCLLLITVAGCASERPAFTVEINGRRLDFEEFREGNIPQGVASRFTLSGMTITGREAIEVNGLQFFADGQDLTVEGKSLRLVPEAQVLVHKTGEVEVRVPITAPTRRAKTVKTPAGQESASSSTSPTTSPVRAPAKAPLQRQPQPAKTRLPSRSSVPMRPPLLPPEE